MCKIKNSIIKHTCTNSSDFAHIKKIKGKKKLFIFKWG